MYKRVRIVSLLLVCVLLLSACGAQQKERFPVNQGAAGSVTQAPASLSNTSYSTDYDYDSGEYDPSSEEDGGYYVDQSPVTVYEQEPVYTLTPVLTSEYAGATPVVINPIDMPTPTPAPELKITEYQTYDATKIRLSFDGPVGWTIDDTLSDTYVLTNPDSTVSYQAKLTVTARAVSAEMTESDLKREVKSVISGMKGDYKSFNTTQTASRTLFDKKGIYEDFDGVLKGSDVHVWGRVHAVCLNKTLVIMQLVAPYEYSRTYKDTVYSKFRHTVKFTH